MVPWSCQGKQCFTLAVAHVEPILAAVKTACTDIFKTVTTVDIQDKEVLTRLGDFKLEGSVPAAIMAYSRIAGTVGAEVSFVYKFGTTMAACSKLQLHLLGNPERKDRKIRADLVDLVLSCRSSSKEFRANFSTTDEVTKLGMFDTKSTSLGRFMDVSSPPLPCNT